MDERAVLDAVAAALAAQDAERESVQVLRDAQARFRARYPEPPPRKGWKAYEDWHKALDRACRREAAWREVCHREARDKLAHILVVARAEHAA